MVVISRRENEGIVIDDNVIVTVLEIAEDFVRLAIQSPDHIPPYREEVIQFNREFAL